MQSSHSLPTLGKNVRGTRAATLGHVPSSSSTGLTTLTESAWEEQYENALEEQKQDAKTRLLRTVSTLDQPSVPRSLLGSKRNIRPKTAPLGLLEDPTVTPRASALYEINDIRDLMQSNPSLLRQASAQSSMAQLQRQTQAYRQNRRIDPNRGKWKRKPSRPNPVVWYYSSRNVVSSFEIEELPAQDIYRSQQAHITTNYLSGPIRSFSVENHIKEREYMDQLKAKTLADKGEDFPGPGYYGVPRPYSANIKGGYLATADYGDRLRMPDASGASQAELLYQKMGELARSQSSNKKFNCISHQPFMMPAQPLKKGQVNIIQRNKSESHLWTKKNREQRIRKNAQIKEERLDRVQQQAEERYIAFLAAKKQSIQKYDTSHRLYMKQRREAARNRRAQLKNWLMIIEHTNRVMAIRRFLDAQGEINLRRRACQGILRHWRAYRSRLRRRKFTSVSCLVNTFMIDKLAKIEEQKDFDLKKAEIEKIIEYMQNIAAYKTQVFRTAGDALVAKTVRVQRAWRNYLITRKWRLWTFLVQLERFRDSHMWVLASGKIASFKTERAERIKQSAQREKRKKAQAEKKGTKYHPPPREPDNPWLVEFLQLEQEDPDTAIARLCSLYKSNSKRKMRQIPKELHIHNHYSHPSHRPEVEYDVAQELLRARNRKFKDNLRSYYLLRNRIVQEHEERQLEKRTLREKHISATLTNMPEALLGEDEKRLLAARGERRNDEERSQQELQDKLNAFERQKPFFRNKYEKEVLVGVFDVVFHRLKDIALEEHRLKKLHLSPGHHGSHKSNKSLLSETAVQEMVAAHAAAGHGNSGRSELLSRGDMASPPEGAKRPVNSNTNNKARKQMLRTREGVRAQVTGGL